MARDLVVTGLMTHSLLNEPRYAPIFLHPSSQKPFPAFLIDRSRSNDRVTLICSPATCATACSNYNPFNLLDRHPVGSFREPREGLQGVSIRRMLAYADCGFREQPGVAATIENGEEGSRKCQYLP